MKKFLLCSCLMLFSLIASATAKETVVQAQEVDIGYTSPLTTTVINLDNGITFQVQNSVVFTDCPIVLSIQATPFQAVEQVNAMATVYRAGTMPSTTFRQRRCTGINWISNYCSLTSYNSNRHWSWPPTITTSETEPKRSQSLFKLETKVDYKSANGFGPDPATCYFGPFRIWAS